MAEMEQYLNDIFRFYDDESMHSVLIERIDLVIGFHDGYKELDPELFANKDKRVHSRNAVFV